MPNLQKPESNFMPVGEGKKIREKREKAKELNGSCIRWTAIALKSKLSVWDFALFKANAAKMYFLHQIFLEAIPPSCNNEQYATVLRV